MSMDRSYAMRRLASEPFDFLVVGGGISGAGVAREASLRGLRVALVEQSDFACGTSSRSTKLIHGGLRYLKQFDFKLVREGVEERQRLLEMAPHLVWVTPFVFPVYRGDPDSLLMLRTGLFIYDLFARMKAAVPHRLLGASALLQQEPGLRHDGLVGGAIYTDCRTDDGRLTLAVVQSAAAYGAAVANYAGVQAFLRDPSGRLVGAQLRDVLSGDTLDVRAGRILAAAGPWADEIRRLDDPNAKPLLRLTKGVHLVVPRHRLPLSNAVVMRGQDQRMMFAVPSGGYSYVGTTDTDHTDRPCEARVEPSDIDYILEAANQTFPDARLTPDDVTSAWVGLRPLIMPTKDVDPSAVSRDYALFYCPSGLVSVGGGKLTAFRAMASHIVDTLFPTTRRKTNLMASLAPLPGADGPMPGPADWKRLASQTGASPEQIEQWSGEYGASLHLLAEQLPAMPTGDPALDWYRARARYAVRREMAQRLEDLYCRRTDLMLFSADNGRRYLQPLATEMAAMLGWSPERTEEEVARCRSLIEGMFAWRQVAPAWKPAPQGSPCMSPHPA